MSKSARRHHRVAKKQIVTNQKQGVLFSGKIKKKFLINMIITAIIIFLDGLILGILISKKN